MSIYRFPQYTAQKMKFSIQDFFSKCDQIRRKVHVRSHMLKKSLIENFIFCAEIDPYLDQYQSIACYSSIQPRSPAFEHK